jgi:ketosteroid isomerase-like protein
MTQPKFGSYIESLQAGFRKGDATAADKREETANLKLIEEVVLAIGRGDPDALNELLADDIRLEIHSAQTLPFIHSATGKRDFLNAVRHNFGELESQQPEIEAVVAQGDTIIVVSREEGVLRASGDKYELRGMHRYVCRDGKISLVQEFLVPAD